MGRHSVSRGRWQVAPRMRRPLLALLAVLAVILVGSLIRPPYVVFRAGPAVDILGEFDGAKVIEVSGGRTYPTSGELAFTTVAQYGGPGVEVNAWDLVLAGLDPQAEIVSRDQVYPHDATREQLDQATSAQMSGSQHAAEAVALRALGYPEQAVVAEVVPGTPAAGLLRPGDVVLVAGGRRVEHTFDVPAAVQATAAGTDVPLRVRRGAKDVELAVSTTEQAGRRVMGIGLQARFSGAPAVKVNAGHVGGPSAGMMFALAIYDVLTPGALTGGKDIAGTGTIGLDGTIGPIGGIRHKMIGAHDGGAGYFLAPAPNCPEVTGHVPDSLTVVKVSTFAQARVAVGAIADGRAQTLPSCG